MHAKVESVSSVLSVFTSSLGVSAVFISVPSVWHCPQVFQVFW